MNLRLPVPIFTEKDTYTELEYKKPTGLILANTKDVLQSSNEYMGIRTLISGCTESIHGENNTITDPLSIKSMIFKMPNKSVEYVSTQLILAFYNGEDYVGGVYPCPLCGELCICRLTEEVDNRDRLSDLDVHFMEDWKEDIEIQLTAPSIIYVKGEETSIESITLSFPTLEHHHKAFVRYGNTNLYRFQFGIYAEALKAVNGMNITDEWRKPYGIKIFENMPEVKSDCDKLSEFINSYGIDLRVRKNCSKCGAVWQPVINTSNFFGSALQSL